MAKDKRILYRLITGPIRFYQAIISPFLGPRCRFYPSCSDYAIDAINEFGLMKGFFLSLYRLLRCHPFSKGGHDPVPSRKEKSQWTRKE